MNLSIANWRVWLYRALVAIACGLMLASFIMPWWTARLSTMPVNVDGIRIYGWGLRENLHLLAQYAASDVTPLYQIILAWIYMAVSIGLVLFSSWVKGRKGALLLGAISLIYIAYVLTAVFFVISRRLEHLSIPLQGIASFIGQGKTLYIYTRLQHGYYLAYIAGGICFLLALTRNIITGKPIQSHGAITSQQNLTENL
jgi:hypothetical protein